MNSKVIIGILVVVTIASLVFGYTQKQAADFQKAKLEEMHREVVRLRNESEAARAEASKLRQVIEIERKKEDETTSKK